MDTLDLFMIGTVDCVIFNLIEKNRLEDILDLLLLFGTHQNHTKQAYSLFSGVDKTDQLIVAGSSRLAHRSTSPWPMGPLKLFPKGYLFYENCPLGNCFPHWERMNKIFLQGNEIGKVIEEQIWTK